MRGFALLSALAVLASGCALHVSNLYGLREGMTKAEVRQSVGHKPTKDEGARWEYLVCGERASVEKCKSLDTYVLTFDSSTGRLASWTSGEIERERARVAALEARIATLSCERRCAYYRAACAVGSVTAADRFVGETHSHREVARVLHNFGLALAGIQPPAINWSQENVVSNRIESAAGRVGAMRAAYCDADLQLCLGDCEGAAQAACAKGVP